MLRLVVLIAFLAGPAHAQMFTPDELTRVEERAVPTIRTVFRRDVIGNLPRDLRRDAARITLGFPEQGRTVLDFYAEPGPQTVNMPLESIRFLDDLATASAWFAGHDCPDEAIHAYLYLLLRKGERLASPLRTFAIDRDAAFADAFTYDLSDKIYSSALQFILAHEVGHLVLHHRAGLSGAASQAQEIAADAFAADHFARLGAPPIGVTWYFLAAWYFDPLTGDRPRGSHPVSPERIRALAGRMLASPDDFAHAAPDPADEASRVADIATGLMALAGMIDDDGMLGLMPESLLRDFPRTRFARVCPSS